MESTEEDAGAPGTSTRGQDATRESDDIFDGGSIPSPSEHHPSTEAILDMIDEIVDGPDANKCQSVTATSPAASLRQDTQDSVSVAEPKVEITLIDESVAASVKSEDTAPASVSSVVVAVTESISLLENRVESVESPQAGSSIPEVSESEVLPAPAEECQTVNDISDCSLPNIPFSSNVQATQDISHLSDCEPVERTVKCLISSVCKDNVAVESVEATCSEGHQRDPKDVPIRRRLVRPAPSDRRPDTTVSSTADSLSSNLSTTTDVGIDSITKDVSSSSDAISMNSAAVDVRDNVRSNSEVSICKAETSVSPTRKIKLIRNKVLPSISSPDNRSEIQNIAKDICQSTSDPVSLHDLVVPSTSVNCSSTSQIVCEDDNSISVIVSEASNNKNDGNENVKSKDSIVNVTHTIVKTTDNSGSDLDVIKQNDLDAIRQNDKKLGNDHECKIEESVLNSDNSNILESSSKVTYFKDKDEDNKVVDTIKDDSNKQVPKLTIKLGPKFTESPPPIVPKLTIKPLKPPPVLEGNECNDENKQFSCITKLTIKPIPKPAEKATEVHRKSSSSEISESECSENDDTTSTSDHTSASEQGTTDAVPKVTIKLGKPGTESEGKFYTEKTVPKLTIKSVQNEEHDHDESMLKIRLKVSQTEDKQHDRVPKLTIKPVTKGDGQPMSPKLTIKPLKPPDTKESNENQSESLPIPKLKISQESALFSSDNKDNSHIPKLTIKPVLKCDDSLSKSNKRCLKSDNNDQIPQVTKLNIKPILKPTESKINAEPTDSCEENVPVVSKLNIKPVIKPKDLKMESDIEEVPHVTKLNIKPIKNPDEGNLGQAEKSIPVVTKLNIKPIVKPMDGDNKSETENSSDENSDIPIVTKINIKPLIKPNEVEESTSYKVSSADDSIPVVTKLNIKPLLKPTDCASSPKRDIIMDVDKNDIRNDEIPIVTKLNIKPLVKPNELDLKCNSPKSKDERDDINCKNPPIVMKFNFKSMTDAIVNDCIQNNIDDPASGVNSVNDHIPKVTKINIKPLHSPTKASQNIQDGRKLNCQLDNAIDVASTDKSNSILAGNYINEISSSNEPLSSSPIKRNHDNDKYKESDTKSVPDKHTQDLISINLNLTSNSIDGHDSDKITCINDYLQKEKSNEVKGRNEMTQNCTLLKKLLEVRKSDTEMPIKKVSKSLDTIPKVQNISKNDSKLENSENVTRLSSNITNHTVIKEANYVDDYSDSKEIMIKTVSNKPTTEKSDLLSKPLEIVTEKSLIPESSGQDSPRIILKINKTDHGTSAKIITEETVEEFNEGINEAEHERNRQFRKLNRKSKLETETTNITMAKRLRSSRAVEETTPVTKRNANKKVKTVADVRKMQEMESGLSSLDNKRLKLEQILAGNTSLTVTKITNMSPDKSEVNINNINHGCNENHSKNGSSKLHNILSNLHAKNDLQCLPFKSVNCSDEKPKPLLPEIDSTSTSSSDVVEIIPIENTRPTVQEMIINENSNSQCNLISEELSQDPLDISCTKGNLFEGNDTVSTSVITSLMTPQPRKRGRPRKFPISEGGRPAVPLPVTALEERPQRSLRLTRERPQVITTPRGRRGRGRGSKRSSTDSQPQVSERENNFFPNDHDNNEEEIDPTSSRIKLPRMTEALDKMPSICLTPLSTRRESSVDTKDIKLFGESAQLKVVLDEIMVKSPESLDDTPRRGKGGRGGRGGRGSRGGKTPMRSPRSRGGRGRGGGRGAVYMKETMGIYGRVCGPATTTVQLFEEETCMMDDNATPAKPSHLLDEDSQSSVKSSTNDSSKTKKSKFADLFDSSKQWTAADVKEYTWSPADQEGSPRVMMIQEQVSMFLGVKSFKRKYPELKRRTISATERDYVLSQGLVTEALCDLGMTAVDAGEVLDIMLSDFPHKYEEYRSHQRERQLTDPVAPSLTVDEVKTEEKSDKLEPKSEMKEHKTEALPERTRQDMAAAAIASASEWNTRLNALRRPACVDLQSMTINRRRAPLPPPSYHVAPPAGFYPLALLPGQYQHCYRQYPTDVLNCFPLNTVLKDPPPVVECESSSESEPDWASPASSSDDSDNERSMGAKRRKLTKVKRNMTFESATKEDVKETTETADTCRTCGLREEANRKFYHERFLACSKCHAKLHPACIELGPDTIRKCRDYPWQCAECKSCYSCLKPADDDKMLFCDLCDRGFHIYCVGLEKVPSGRWHCVECAICKSCGARTAGGMSGPDDTAEWHHQSKRGPGGHKVYSHSLCTPCARAYRIGRYCPLCERSFIGPKGTMQLVICKLCDRQLHQDCVKQTVTKLNIMDYTCNDCRRSGITSRSAAVRLAPRTIATLFMAKRRFNKYAHRQYVQSRLKTKTEPENASSEDTNEPAADVSDPDETVSADYP